jgi:cytoskeletal protein CcmA (bactofilin family)
MWKSSDNPSPEPRSPNRTDAPPQPGSAPPPSSERSRGPAVIGPSIAVKGEVSGSEDLRIEGKVDGKVALTDHTVFVGSGGEVQGEIEAKVVELEGRVEGDVAGSERIVIRKSARVRGDLVTPRVVIEDGARFKGTIDMDFEEPGSRRASSSAATGPARLDKPRETPSTGGSAPPDKEETPGAGTASASSSQLKI